MRFKTKYVLAVLITLPFITLSDILGESTENTESDLLKAIPLPVDRLPVAQAAPLYNGEYGDRPEYFQAQPPQVMTPTFRGPNQQPTYDAQPILPNTIENPYKTPSGPQNLALYSPQSAPNGAHRPVLLVSGNPNSPPQVHIPSLSPPTQQNSFVTDYPAPNPPTREPFITAYPAPNPVTRPPFEYAIPSYPQGPNGNPYNPNQNNQYPTNNRFVPGPNRGGNRSPSEGYESQPLSPNQPSRTNESPRNYESQPSSPNQPSRTNESPRNYESQPLSPNQPGRNNESPRNYENQPSSPNRGGNRSPSEGYESQPSSPNQPSRTNESPRNYESQPLSPNQPGRNNESPRNYESQPSSPNQPSRTNESPNQQNVPISGKPTSPQNNKPFSPQEEGYENQPNVPSGKQPPGQGPGQKPNFPGQEKPERPSENRPRIPEIERPERPSENQPRIPGIERPERPYVPQQERPGEYPSTVPQHPTLVTSYPEATKPQFPGQTTTSRFERPGEEFTHQPTIPPFEQRPGQTTPSRFERPGEEFTHQPTIPPFEQRPGQTTPSRFERPELTTRPSHLETAPQPGFPGQFTKPPFPGETTQGPKRPGEEFTQPTIPPFEQRPGQTTTSRFERPEFTTQPSRLETVPQPGFPGGPHGPPLKANERPEVTTQFPERVPGQFTKPQFPGEETHQPTIPPFEQRPGQTTPSRFERPKEQPSFPGKPTPFGQKPREEFTPQPTVPQFEQRPGQTTTSRFERPEFTTQPSRLETVPQPGFPGGPHGPPLKANERPEFTTQRPGQQFSELTTSRPGQQVPEITTSRPGQQVPEFTTQRPGQQFPELTTSRPGQQVPEFTTSRPFGSTEFPNQPPQERIPGQPIPPSYQPPTTIPPITIPIPGQRPKEMIPNRIRGKSRIICEESGVEFGFRPLFPFTGQIFAHDRKRVPSCVHNFNQAYNVNVSFSYAECGIANNRNDSYSADYHLQIIVMFEQPNGETSIQSFIAQCGQSRLKYQKQSIPKRIEEALEELRLVPAKLEQKAPVPDCKMKLVTDVEHHGHGDGEDISQIEVGKPMRLEFTLEPESDAYGLLIHNCVIRDLVSGSEHEIIDAQGCSTDLNIVAHPYYDTYHDIVRVHAHAFKLPDHTRLSIKCDFQICTEIKDEHGKTSCQEIGTPPFCPDIITSPQNSVLFDGRSNNVWRRVRRSHQRNIGNSTFIFEVDNDEISDGIEQSVHADLCLGGNEFCNNDFSKIKQKHLQRIEEENNAQQLDYCMSRYTLAFGTGLSVWILFIGLGLHLYLFLRSHFGGN